MSTVSIEEAQAKLPELIAHLSPGEEVVITRNERPVATLVGPHSETSQPVFGRGRGKIEIVSDDNEHLEHFKDYLP
ncbi:MAG TPA: type II toxin-antitoxin system Phd/YefM family antitoxin [Pirellulales bacterium]|jgi:antitoxin (DNA-binding transcriptional repressor) of toxin-antitoxin stability system|nr:type II toxin-antitoxin system Phd/YefM family antitoxin [Pirellulales bacterium]